MSLTKTSDIRASASRNTLLQIKPLSNSLQSIQYILLNQGHQFSQQAQVSTMLFQLQLKLNHEKLRFALNHLLLPFKPKSKE